MTCDETLDALRRGAPLGPEAQAHVQSCELCQELTAGGAQAARVLDAPANGLGDTEQMLAVARQHLAGERGIRGSLRSQPTNVRIAIALSALCVVAMMVGLLGARPDIAAYPLARLVFSIACLLAAAFSATSLALRPPYRTPTGTWRWALVLSVAVPLLLAALPEAHASMDISLEGRGEDFLPRAVGCFTFGAALALPVLTLILAMTRVSWSHKAVLASAAAGVGGVAALELHCPLTSQAHILVGHAAVVVAMAIATAAVWSLRRS